MAISESEKASFFDELYALFHWPELSVGDSFSRFIYPGYLRGLEPNKTVLEQIKQQIKKYSLSGQDFKWLYLCAISLELLSEFSPRRQLLFLDKILRNDRVDPVLSFLFQALPGSEPRNFQEDLYQLKAIQYHFDNHSLAKNINRFQKDFSHHLSTDFLIKQNQFQLIPGQQPGLHLLRNKIVRDCSDPYSSLWYQEKAFCVLRFQQWQKLAFYQYGTVYALSLRTDKNISLLFLDKFQLDFKRIQPRALKDLQEQILFEYYDFVLLPLHFNLASTYRGNRVLAKWLEKLFQKHALHFIRLKASKDTKLHFDERDLRRFETFFRPALGLGDQAKPDKHREYLVLYKKERQVKASSLGNTSLGQWKLSEASRESILFYKHRARVKAQS